MTLEVNRAGFRVGQVWHYKTRPQEPNSTFTIVRIDNLPGGTVIHISVRSVKVRNPRSKTGFSETIAHSPFWESAIRQSVDQLAEENAESPNYEEGYREWRRAIDAGEGGVFTISVAESIDLMEHILCTVEPRHIGRTEGEN